MLLNFEHLKTFYSALKQKMKNFRGNWNQNDPTADDYIKNRPFYSEGAQEVIILHYTVDTDAQSASPMISAGPARYNISFDAEGLQPFIVDQEYSIKWNNETYICKAKLFEDIPSLGDTGLVEGYADTGEPFLIAISPEYHFGVIITTEAGKYPITITTRQEVVHKLDKKFIDIPDNLVTTDIMEEIYEDLQSSIPDNIVTYDNISDALPEAVVTTDELATVATTGSYDDLLDIPDSLVSLHKLVTPDTASMPYIPVAVGPGPTARSVLLTTAAYGSQYKAYVSNDYGLTWEYQWLPSHIPTSSSYRPRIIVGGQFKNEGIHRSLLLGYPNNYFAYFEDDKYKLEELTINIPKEWAAACVGDYRFILIAGADHNTAIDDTYASSIAATCVFDGSTKTYRWDEMVLPVSTVWTDVKHSSFRRVTVAIGAGDVAAYSTDDGLTWNATSMPFNAKWRWLAASMYEFVAVSEEGYAAYSEDGITWVALTDEENKPLAGPIERLNANFISFSTTDTEFIRYSTDGKVWHTSSIRLPKKVNCSILFGIEGSYLCFDDTKQYLQSGDGLVWSEIALQSKYGADSNEYIAKAIASYVLTNPDIGLVGFSEDTADKNTIYGAKSYADARTQAIDFDTLDNICTQMKPGLYTTGAIDAYEADGQEGIVDMLTMSWDQLLDEGIMTISSSGELSTNSTMRELSGDLLLPEDKNILTIGLSAFSNCENLTRITIPDSVTKIGITAFGSCINLTQITIPNAVTYIGESAFTACFKLTEITFEGTVEQWNAITRHYRWNYNVPATYVQCTDGQVSL